MSRQNRNPERDRKTEDTKREVAASNERYQRTDAEDRDSDQEKDFNQISGLDRYGMNDLYERSSI